MTMCECVGVSVCGVSVCGIRVLESEGVWGVVLLLLTTS